MCAAGGTICQQSVVTDKLLLLGTAFTVRDRASETKGKPSAICWGNILCAKTGRQSLYRSALTIWDKMYLELVWQKCQAVNA